MIGILYFLLLVVEDIVIAIPVDKERRGSSLVNDARHVD